MQTKHEQRLRQAAEYVREGCADALNYISGDDLSDEQRLREAGATIDEANKILAVLEKEITQHRNIRYTFSGIARIHAPKSVRLKRVL